MAYTIEGRVNMRKYIVVSILLLCSAVCILSCTRKGRDRDIQNSSSSETERSNMKWETVKYPVFLEIDRAGIDWASIEFPVDSKEIVIPDGVSCIITKVDAITIGEAIIQNFWRNDTFTDYILVSVVHSTEDNIWRFDYSVDQRKETDGTYLLCGGLSVAIEGNNCSVVKAWVEE